MTWVSITGLSLIAFGVLLFWVGWKLNTETPVQQPLPAVGVVFVLVGVGFLFVSLGRAMG